MLKLLSYLVAGILISTKIAKEVESVIGLHLDNQLKEIKFKQEEDNNKDKGDSTQRLLAFAPSIILTLDTQNEIFSFSKCHRLWNFEVNRA